MDTKQIFSRKEKKNIHKKELLTEGEMNKKHRHSAISFLNMSPF